MTYKRAAKSDKLDGKAWRITASSTDGTLVTLGKYDTKESADSDKARIEEEGYYRDLKITYSPPPVKPVEGEEVEAVPERKPAMIPPEEPDVVAVVEADDEAVVLAEDEGDEAAE